MSFKEFNSHHSFFDLEVKRSFGQARTQKFLLEVDNSINWEPLAQIVTENYLVGQSEYGHKTYPPLMLLKALLLQKWFGITSDPELENQNNDRFSFKTFTGLPFSVSRPVSGDNLKELCENRKRRAAMRKKTSRRCGMNGVLIPTGR